jgi:hypothetical protein
MIATNRQLMWHGMFLFVLGLITGLAEQRFTNVRMGLAAHLEGAVDFLKGVLAPKPNRELEQIYGAN